MIATLAFALFRSLSMSIKHMIRSRLHYWLTLMFSPLRQIDWRLPLQRVLIDLIIVEHKNKVNFNQAILQLT